MIEKLKAGLEILRLLVVLVLIAPYVALKRWTFLAVVAVLATAQTFSRRYLCMYSFQVTEAFVTQWGSNFMHLAQQKVSRLERTVTVQRNVVGVAATFNRIGKTAAQKKTTRHGDTPLIETPHSTRFADLSDYEWADLVDQLDKKKMLADPTSEYLAAGISAMNRSKDEVIVAAMFASARSGTSSTVALPATQIIAAGGTGLTKAKLIQAKKMFRVNEMDAEAGQELFIAYTGEQLEDMLNQTEVTSSDYNNVKALIEGTIKRWMGFEWVPTELLPKVSTTRKVPAWAKASVGLAIGDEIKTRLTERADKSYSLQPFASMSLGAVRIEDEGVVEIDCVE